MVPVPATTAAAAATTAASVAGVFSSFQSHEVGPDV